MPTRVGNGIIVGGVSAVRSCVCAVCIFERLAMGFLVVFFSFFVWINLELPKNPVPQRGKVTFFVSFLCAPARKIMKFLVVVVLSVPFSSRFICDRGKLTKRFGCRSAYFEGKSHRSALFSENFIGWQVWYSIPIRQWWRGIESHTRYCLWSSQLISFPFRANSDITTDPWIECAAKVSKRSIVRPTKSTVA